jgi:hypothetical protein
MQSPLSRRYFDSALENAGVLGQVSDEKQPVPKKIVDL